MGKASHNAMQENESQAREASKQTVFPGLLPRNLETSYHNSETFLLGTYPFGGSRNQVIELLSNNTVEAEPAQHGQSPCMSVAVASHERGRRSIEQSSFKQGHRPVDEGEPRDVFQTRGAPTTFEPWSSLLLRGFYRGYMGSLLKGY